MAWVAVAIAGLVIAGALTVYAAFNEVFDQIHQVSVIGLGERPPKYNDGLNILVIGSESGPGRSATFGSRTAGQRSDAILVLHLAPGLKRAIVLSIPGNSVVPVPSCPPGAGAPGQPAQPGRIEQVNASFAFGGPGCLWKTIEHTTHIRLDHFIELNFTGFERVVNDLGGIDMCVPDPVSDPHSQLHLSNGLNHVWGATALAYWRAGNTGLGSDLERMQHEQFLMGSIAQEVNPSDLHGDPTIVYHVAIDIASSLTTDSGLTQSTLISLVNGLQTMKLTAVQFGQVPVVAYPPNPNWVEWTPRTRGLFTAIARDRRLPHVSMENGDSAAEANVCHDGGAFTGMLSEPKPGRHKTDE